MKKFSFIIALFFSLITTVITAQTSSEHLNALLSTFKSMSADFSQTVYVKNQAAKKSVGKMALMRPGKFRWEVTSPNHQLIVADGRYLWIYDVDLEQATKQSLTKDAQSPAILLSGSTKAIEDRFSLVGAKEHGNQAEFKLTPKRPNDMVQYIELKFIDNKLNQMAVIDNLGQKNVFTFTNLALNPQLAPSLFQFKAPKGVDVIKN